MAPPCLPPSCPSILPQKDTVAFGVDPGPGGPEMTLAQAPGPTWSAHTSHRGPEYPGNWSLVMGERLLVLVWWGDWDGTQDCIRRKTLSCLVGRSSLEGVGVAWDTSGSEMPARAATQVF